MSDRLNPRAAGAALITILFWSSAFAGIRAGLRSYSPVHLALLRFLVASAVLALLAAARRLKLPPRRDLPGIALLGMIGITVYHVALNIGEVTVTAGAASLIIAAVPIFSALLATAFTGERLTRWGWAGILLSFGGVALIVLGEGEGVRFDPGALLILLSALASAIYFVFQRQYLKRSSALAFTTVSIWFGTLVMLVFAPGLVGAIRAAPLADTLAVVYLGVFPAAIAYATWNYALSQAPASIVSSMLYVNPVLAILIAWVWLGELPDGAALVGGAIALVGVVIVNTRGR